VNFPYRPTLLAQSHLIYVSRDKAGIVNNFEPDVIVSCFYNDLLNTVCPITLYNEVLYFNTVLLTRCDWSVSASHDQLLNSNVLSGVGWR